MGFSAFERWVAMRYLRARRQQGFISVVAAISLLGIALGVATLIIVMAVMNGFREELLGRILGVNGHLTVYSNQGSMTDYEGLSERLLAWDGIIGVIPQIQAQVMVSQGGSAVGALVRGVRPGDLAGRALIADNVKLGSLDGFASGGGVLIGTRLAQNLRLGVGDQITLVSPRGNQTVVGTLPRIKSYPIAGLFEVGMYEYDSSFVYMPLADAQKFFRLPDRINAVELFLANPDHVSQLRLEIVRNLGPDYRTVDWQQANSSFFSAVRVERNVMALILTLIILVATFNIISGQIVLVRDKSHDIAILRTMGATRGMILRIFLMTGTIIGSVGTFFGCLVGIAFAQNIDVFRKLMQSLTGTELFPAEIYFLSQLPSKIVPAEVVTVAVVALGLSFLATLYPSWRAARLDPVEALRYE